VVSGVLERAVSILERRFLTNAFLPVLLFFPAAATPVVVHVGAIRQIATAWDAQSTALRLLELVGYFSGVWFLAAILASQWRNITRLYEGYYLNTRSAPYRLGVRHHQYCLRALDRDRYVRPESAERRFYGYPPSEDDVMPTRLGNILRAAERYSFDRFGAEGVFFWSRLYHVLDPEFAVNVEESRARMEFLLVISLWCALFAGTVLLTLGVTHAPGLLIAGYFAVAMLVAHRAYVAALGAAEEYGERIRAGFELFRFKLLQELSVGGPATLREERNTWKELFNFLAGGVVSETGFTYQEAPTPEVHVTVVHRF
jgi:hypothetical protein